MQYPGQRVQAQRPYQPTANQFGNNGQATSHFVSYGGGNALVLQQGGMAHPQVGATPATSQPQYVQVTLPAGVEPGQTLRVQAPNGRLNEIIVPPGMGPGSTFTVEFAEEAPAQKFSDPIKPVTSSNQYTPPGAVAATATAIPANDLPPQHNYDDGGFANALDNPNFVPSAAATNAHSSYPSASDARPVYNSPPAYPASTY